MFRLRQRLRRIRLRATLRRTGWAPLCRGRRRRPSEYLGQPIAAIRLVVDGHDTSEPALSRVLDVHVGEPLSMRGVRESVLHLFAMGRFDDVRVDASRQGTGVAVRFDIIATRPVSAIRFAGTVHEPGIDEGQLRKAVTERAGPSPPLTRIDELSRVVEAALRTRGYLQARVSGRFEPSGADHSALVFDLQPGTRGGRRHHRRRAGRRARGVPVAVADGERHAVRARRAAGAHREVRGRPPRPGLLRS